VKLNTQIVTAEKMLPCLDHWKNVSLTAFLQNSENVAYIFAAVSS